MSRRLAVGMALIVSGCDALPTSAATPSPTPAPATTTAAGVADRGVAGLRMAGPAHSSAIAAVQAEAGRQKMTGVKVSRGQSFSVVEGARTTATLVTGEGSLPDAKMIGCFVATVQGDEVMLIPTLGYGDYELETCGGPLAVGLLSSGKMSRIGVIYRSYSRDAEQTVPIVVEWDRSNNTLLIDEVASRRALDSGADTIAKMREVVGRG